MMIVDLASLRSLIFRQRGLTMMELLVTVAILSLLMAGLSQLVVTNSKNANATGELARIADTGRTAIQLLSADIRRAGYLGGYVESLSRSAGDTGTLGVPASAAQCSDANSDWARMVDQPVFGLNDSNAGYSCIADESYLRGDILTVRYAQTPPIEVSDMVVTKPYLRVNVSERKVFIGADANNSDNTLEQLLGRDYNLAAHSYFVGPTGRTCQDREIPALFRKAIDVNGRPYSQELLAGVENLQLRYLVNNRYFDADDVPVIAGGIWPQVDAIEVNVLVRAECPEAGFDADQTFEIGDVVFTPAEKDFRRQVFSTTTTLRN
jgi:prepilin-type N-terminal cleavage/methylation domain-containing protein